ncbi:MAG: PDZ domain-containing protein [Dehalococcoidia bacterium]|nr:PDZ domain-containing protein [Dehalococcoidia bacterium]
MTTPPTPPTPPADTGAARPRPRWQHAATALAVASALLVAYVLASDAVSAALIFMVILVVLIVAHELAHFVTAKLFGVCVQEFGLGFPPRLCGKRLGETEYTINWLPLGGFVRLLGEEDPRDQRSLARKPRWQRFIVLSSGAVVNLVLPVLLFAIAFSLPHEEAIGRAAISSVDAGSPAAAAGLMQGDVIYEIGGRDAKNVAAAGRLVRLNLGKTIDVMVKRGGEFVTVSVVPRWSAPDGQGPTGIVIGAQYPFTETVAEPPWRSLPLGLRATADTMILARNEIIGWFRGGAGPQFAGPVGIAQTTGEVARAGGVPPLFELAALLSINLGIINLLPLPALDGGRLVFLLLEVVRRGKRVAPEREALVHLVGLVLFIVLAVVVTFGDVSRIVSGDSMFR